MLDNLAIRRAKSAPLAVNQEWPRRQRRHTHADLECPAVLHGLVSEHEDILRMLLVLNKHQNLAAVHRSFLVCPDAERRRTCSG